MEKYFVSTSLINSFFGIRDNVASIASITYDARKTGCQSYSQVQLRSFMMASPPNIYNWSSFGSGQTDTLNFNWSSTDYAAVVPGGSYDAPGLAAALTIAMNDITSSTNFVVSYDINLAKFTITSAIGTFTMYFTATGAPWLELGFAKAIYAGNTTYTSPYQANLTFSSSILIYIPEMSGGMLNIVNGFPATFIIAVGAAGEYINSWSYLREGPSHIQDLGVERNVSSFSIKLYYIRGGLIYPLICDNNYEYSIDLMFGSQRRA